MLGFGHYGCGGGGDWWLVVAERDGEDIDGVFGYRSFPWRLFE